MNCHKSQHVNIFSANEPTADYRQFAAPQGQCVISVSRKHAQFPIIDSLFSSYYSIFYVSIILILYEHLLYYTQVMVSYTYNVYCRIISEHEPYQNVILPLTDVLYVFDVTIF